MTTGRLAYMPKPGIVELREYDLPEAEPGALLIETAAAGVCGTDLHIYADQHPLKSVVLGHEVIGRVIDPSTRPTDSAGTPLQAGDLVSAMYFAFCQHCRPCSRGQTHLCENAYNHWLQPPDVWPHFTGTFGTHYYVGRHQHLFKVPDNVPPLAVVSANCALAQVSAGVDRANVTAGDTVVIQGAGASVCGVSLSPKNVVPGSSSSMRCPAGSRRHEHSEPSRRCRSRRRPRPPTASPESVSSPTAEQTSRSN